MTKVFFALGIFEWRVRVDNPNVHGWAVVAAYAVASALCARCGWLSRNRSDEQPRLASMWWLFAAGLLFLSINKQLNLQTLLIVLGRHLARAGDWFGRRRLVQAVFSAVFALTGLGAVTATIWHWRGFLKNHPIALVGVIDLLGFLILRAASIDHVFEHWGLELHDKRWAWVLEIFGSACIAAAALRYHAEKWEPPVEVKRN